MDPPQHLYGNNEARQRSASHSAPMPDLQSQLTGMIWEAGSRQVQDTFKSYGRIDLFRPYFDVEVAQVKLRLLRSFLPRKPRDSNLDLYGPSMIVLTMVALLLFNMKSSGYVVPSGTLMGTSLFTCFGSWMFLSGAIYVICFLLAAEIPLLSILTNFGYSLTSHCLVLLLTSMFHTSHDHLYFFVLVGIFCIPSAIRVALFVCSRARLHIHKLTLLGTTIAVHFLLITYLHFGFHVMVEEIDQMMDLVESGEVIAKTVAA